MTGLTRRAALKGASAAVALASASAGAGVALVNRSDDIDAAAAKGGVYRKAIDESRWR